jgi:hypothetical protein
VARGETLFNSKPIMITGVKGLNDDLDVLVLNGASRPQFHGNPASRASRSAKACSTSALTSETASHSMPNPVACAILKPCSVRSADGDARPVSGRT